MDGPGDKWLVAPLPLATCELAWSRRGGCVVGFESRGGWAGFELGVDGMALSWVWSLGGHEMSVPPPRLLICIVCY